MDNSIDAIRKVLTQGPDGTISRGGLDHRHADDQRNMDPLPSAQPTNPEYIGPGNATLIGEVYSVDPATGSGSVRWIATLRASGPEPSVGDTSDLTQLDDVLGQEHSDDEAGTIHASASGATFTVRDDVARGRLRSGFYNVVTVPCRRAPAGKLTPCGRATLGRRTGFGLVADQQGQLAVGDTSLKMQLDAMRKAHGKPERFDGDTISKSARPDEAPDRPRLDRTARVLRKLQAGDFTKRNPGNVETGIKPDTSGDEFRKVLRKALGNAGLR